MLSERQRAKVQRRDDPRRHRRGPRGGRGGMRALWRRFGLWRCARGNHQHPLEFLAVNARPIPIASHVMEMTLASGLYGLAKSNGWCRRCGALVVWSTEPPPNAAPAAPRE